jgi:hypothetical protein
MQQGPQATPQAPVGGVGQPSGAGLYNAAMPGQGQTGLGMIPQTPGLYGSQGGLYSTLQQLAAIGLIQMPGQGAPSQAQAGTTPTGPWANMGGEGGGGGGGGAEGTV